MLRSLGERQGIGVFARNLVPHLLDGDPDTEYVLLHRDRRHLGLAADRPNATEVWLPVPGKALWDQAAVPAAARRHDLDAVFNTKFSLPLLTGRRTVMMLHGSEWFVHPEHSGRLDIRYVRLLMPRYCRKADHLIAVSELTKRDFVRHLGVPPEKITVNPLAAGDRFGPVRDADELRRARARHGLPERFVLTVSKAYAGKNLGGLLAAFARLPGRLDVALVVVGEGMERRVEELTAGRPRLRERIRVLGWLPQEELPAIYAQAELFAFPSWYEGFGIPVVEAMACGCPVVAASTGALPGVTAGAALLVDPARPGELAEAMTALLERPGLRERLSAAGLRRALDFSWARHAERTRRVLAEQVRAA